MWPSSFRSWTACSRVMSVMVLSCVVVCPRYKRLISSLQGGSALIRVFSVHFFGCRAVGCVCFLWAVKIAEVTQLAVFSYLRPPLLFVFIPTHALVAAGVIFIRAAITLIL